MDTRFTATKTEKLRQLIKSGVKWYWDEDLQKLLNEVKESMIESVGYFDLNKKTVLTTNASPVGISGVLTQVDTMQKDLKTIIMCISNALTDTNRKRSFSRCMGN